MFLADGLTMLNISTQIGPNSFCCSKQSKAVFGNVVTKNFCKTWKVRYHALFYHYNAENCFVLILRFQQKKPEMPKLYAHFEQVHLLIWTLEYWKEEYRICPCITRTFFGQNEHVKWGVRIMHGCVIYTGKYGNQKCLFFK